MIRKVVEEIGQSGEALTLRVGWVQITPGYCGW